MTSLRETERKSDGGDRKAIGKKREGGRAKPLLPTSLPSWNTKKKKTHLYKDVHRLLLRTVLTSRRRTSVCGLTWTLLLIFLIAPILWGKIAHYRNPRDPVIKMLHRFAVLAIFAMATVSVRSDQKICKYFKCKLAIDSQKYIGNIINYLAVEKISKLPVYICMNYTCFVYLKTNSKIKAWSSRHSILFIFNCSEKNYFIE